MKLAYNVTGAERKALIGAISQELNTPTKYLGAPTFAYEVGGYHIDKTGTVTGPDNRDLIADLQGLHSFIPVSEEYDATLPEAETTPAYEDLAMTEKEELGLGRERRDSWGEDGMRASDVPEPADEDESYRLVIEMPLIGFTPEKLDNLAKLVNAKAPLLKAALGTDDLPIQHTADTLKFPWFGDGLDAVTVKAYASLVGMICAAAKAKHRVIAQENDPENKKYAMRCWLLSLGFIGDEYKTSRKILLRNLIGNSSFKSGTPLKTTESEVG